MAPLQGAGSRERGRDYLASDTSFGGAPSISRPVHPGERRDAATPGEVVIGIAVEPPSADDDQMRVMGSCVCDT